MERCAKYDSKNVEIINLINNNISINTRIKNEQIEDIKTVAQTIIKAYKQNKKTIWFGNGGSAADAQHLSCELVSKFYMKRPALDSIALTTNTSILTAISNDFNFENIFERQIEASADDGDVLIGITTSGTSKNIIKALQKGKEKNAITVALVGNYLDEVIPFADHIIAIPSDDTPRIQEAHIMIGHILCYLIEKELFGADEGQKKWVKKQSSSIEMEQ